MGQFGDKFRKAREKKELSLDDVSKVIKITPRLLRAIEEEQFEQLPGGVFNKGFIRSYAKHLGLDPEECVAEYLEQIRQEQLKAQEAWQAESSAKSAAAKGAKASRAGREKSKPAATQGEPEELPELQLPRAEHVRPARRSFAAESYSEIPWKLIAAGAAALVLGGLLWVRHSRSEHARAGATAAAEMPVSASSSAVSQPAAVSNPVPQQVSAVTQASPAQAIQVDKEDKSDVTIRKFEKSVAKPAEQGTGALTLVIRASADSWISVMADGKPVTEETLIAPANSTFHASREFTVKVGNAGGVTFVMGGKEIPAQGAEGDVRTLVFDGQGVRVVPPKPVEVSP